jgi:hypothetical protein
MIPNLGGNLIDRLQLVAVKAVDAMPVGIGSGELHVNIMHLLKIVRIGLLYIRNPLSIGSLRFQSDQFCRALDWQIKKQCSIGMWQPIQGMLNVVNPSG